MERVVMLLLLVIFAGAAYVMYDKKNDAQQAQQRVEGELKKEIGKGRITISKTMPELATEFIFMDVTNQYAYLFDTRTAGFKRERYVAYYEWNYTLKFGYAVPRNWNWCIKVIDEKNGIVQVNAPAVTQLGGNGAAPVVKTILNSALYASTEKLVNQEVQRIADEKIATQARVYLDNATLKASVRGALSSFLQDIMNGAYKDARPIRKVEINTVAASQCV